MAVHDLAVGRCDFVQRADVLTVDRYQLDDTCLSPQPARVGGHRAVYDVLDEDARRALGFYIIGDPKRVEFQKRYDLDDNSPDQPAADSGRRA